MKRYLSAAAWRRCSASTRSSAARSACAFPIVPRLSLAGRARRGAAALPRRSRLAADLAHLPRRDRLGAIERLPEPPRSGLELVGGTAFNLGRPGRSDQLELGGGEKPGLQSCSVGHFRAGPIRR
jgi:hypothetical protein